jgi:prepilin-type N-terminal cleavage/methylation domain-containing protein
MHNTRRLYTRGLTLIELAIVIAAISILSTSALMAGGFFKSTQVATTAQKVSQIQAAVKYHLSNKIRIETTESTWGSWGALDSLAVLEGQPLNNPGLRRNLLSDPGFIRQAMPYKQNGMLFEGVFIIENASVGDKGIMIKVRAEDESQREQLHQYIVHHFANHENFYPEILSVGPYRCATSNDPFHSGQGEFLRLCFKY